MTETQNSKQYDLESRTLQFAKDTIGFCKRFEKNVINEEVIRQLVRSAGSVGANYIEANEALSKKDFLMRIKICRKESKESTYWLKLMEDSSCDLADKKKSLIAESVELMKIFGAILQKSQ